MDSASAVRLRQLFLRAAFYALGLMAVLAAVFAVLLVLAKPKLLSFAQSEMRKYGIEARQTDISLLGYVRMRDVSVPLRLGGAARIESLAARPPLYFLGRTWLGGGGTLYGLRFEKEGLAVFVPKLSFSGVALERKNSAIASRSMQMLMRLSARSLYADKIELAAAPEKAAGGAEKEQKAVALQSVISGFSLSGLSGGKIASVSYSGMKTAVSAAAGGASHVRSGAFAAGDIDAVSLYALARSLIPEDENGAEPKIAFPQGARDLSGAVRLRDFDVTAEDAKLGAVHFSAGELASRGFALKGGKTPADFIMRLPAAENKDAAEKAETKKKLILHNLRGLLADMALVDMSARNVTLGVEPRPEALAAAEAARRAQDLRAAQAADDGKTVRDILDEEQERVEQRQNGGANAAGGAVAGASGKPERARFPLQFKLTLSSFALKADHWEQAVPYNFYVKVKDLTFMPGKNSGEALQALRQMGRGDLQFSLLGDVAWNPGNSELALKQVAFYGRDMGGFSLKGTMFDVPKALFDGKPEAVSAALNEAGIGDMEIRLEDSGFIKNLVQWGTTQINISANELQTDLHDIAVKSPPLLLKNRKEAQNFSDVFGSFVSNSGAIVIKMRALQRGGGLKLRDIMASQDDLSALLDKLQLSAGKAPSEPLIE